MSRSVRRIGRRQRAGVRRQTEIENLDESVSRDEHVLGLQVAVNDALVVRRGQPRDDLQGDVERLLQRQRNRG